MTDANNALLWGSNGAKQKAGAVKARDTRGRVVGIPADVMEAFSETVLDEYAFAETTRVVFDLTEPRFAQVCEYLYPNGKEDAAAVQYAAQALSRLLNAGDVLELRDRRLTVFKTLRAGV